MRYAASIALIISTGYNGLFMLLTEESSTAFLEEEVIYIMIVKYWTLKMSLSMAENRDESLDQIIK